MNRLLIYILLSVAVAAAVTVTGFLFYKNLSQPPAEQFLLTFLRKYPEKASIVIERNGALLAEMNSGRRRPLAGAAKIVVAIEFARQASAGTIHPDEYVSLSELSRFYIPNTDGGAHPRWVQYLKEKNLLLNDKLSLIEVARGMMSFSSNACLEFLMMHLGLDNINRNFDLLGMKEHDQLYPFVSALYLFRNTQKIPQDDFLRMMNQLSMSEYVSEALKISRKLSLEKDSSIRRTFVMPSLDLQRLWSGRLPRSTAREYATLLAAIDGDNAFPHPLKELLDTLMQWPMEFNPKNAERFRTVGSTAGSTPFVLANALYADDKKGNKTVIVTFFDDLAPLENQRLSTALALFQLNILTKADFREKIRTTLVAYR